MWWLVYVWSFVCCFFDNLVMYLYDEWLLCIVWFLIVRECLVC